MKLIIPHIHKTLGDAGFFAEISEKGEIKELRVKVLEGLRQIEGILIGRRIFETPLVISRICGICPTSHILSSCQALEKALGIKPSLQTERLRKLITAAQIIQSHAGHAFFISLVDEKLTKESRALLELREFALKIIEMVGGRRVHPIRPRVGGFSKIPEKGDYQRVLKHYSKAYQSALVLLKFFRKIEYPQLSRRTLFCSSFAENDYPYHKGEKIKIGNKILTPADFFSNQIEEDLKTPPAKRVEFQGKSYMPGAIARIKNNEKNLDQEAQIIFKEFKKERGLSEKDFFENTFYNTFCQAIEIIHFLKEVKNNLEELIKEKQEKPFKKFKISKGSGLGVLEAPRGLLFSYFEIDPGGRVLNCNIITPTAQFLRNLEEDLKVLLSDSLKLSKEKKIKKIKTLIRAYDPCISCAVH